MSISYEFEVHVLNDTGISKARRIAEVFSAALRALDEEGLITNGRERSLVVTKLQEACFFAKKSMAQNPDNQREVKP